MRAVERSATRRLIALASLVLLGSAMAGSRVEAGAQSEKSPADTSIQRPLNLGRSPASANPLLELRPLNPARPGTSILRSEQAPPPRWRLMGTCRQDIGMQRSVNGIGYGDCRN